MLYLLNINKLTKYVLIIIINKLNNNNIKEILMSTSKINSMILLYTKKIPP